MRLLLCGLLMLAPVMVQAQEATIPVEIPQDRLSRIHDATVRVSVSGGTGTGTIYKEDENYYYILTNEHVAGRVGNKVGLEFTKDHYPSPRFVGTVTKAVKRSGVDVAEVRILKSSLPSGLNLPVIPLAEPGDAPRELFLITAGCQAGERPSIQMTLTLEDKGNLIYYLPTSRPGRSGSSLVNRDGTKIYGLVAWMTGGSSSKGLAMGVEVIRPILTETTSEYAETATQDFPEDAFEIPLATDQFVGSELETINNSPDACAPDSCFDDKCPWDYQYVNDAARKADNPWLRRYGGPTEPKPQSPQPQNPAIPDNPWDNPKPKPEPQPEPQPDRNRLIDLSRIFERFDRLEPKIDRIEPKIDKLGEDLKPDAEEEARRRRLFDRMETLPDRLIGPDDLNNFAERQSDTLIQRLRNLVWTLLQPFIWVWNIAIVLLIMWGLNTVLAPVFGANWLALIVLWLFGFVRQLFTAIRDGISSIAQPAKPAPKKRTRKPRAKKPVEKVDA